MKKEEKKILAILKLIGLFLLFFTISIIPAAIFNIDITSLTDYQSIIYLFYCNILFLFIIIFNNLKILTKDFKPFFKDFGKNFETSFKYYIVGLGIMIISNLIISFILGGNIANNEEQVRNSINLAPILMIIEVGFYAPIAEELLFRRSFREVINNKWTYIIISGFIFGALHVIGCENPLEYLYLIPYCSLGIALSYIYAKTDNIYSTITIHAAHNLTTVILFLIGAAL